MDCMFIIQINSLRTKLGFMGSSRSCRRRTQEFQLEKSIRTISSAIGIKVYNSVEPALNRFIAWRALTGQ